MVELPRPRRNSWIHLGPMLFVAFSGLMLEGCGGGGSVTPSPAPTVTTTTTTTMPPSKLVGHVSVLEYNLDWECVSGDPDAVKPCPQFADGKGFKQLYDKIKKYGPSDLLALQECKDIAQVVKGIGYQHSHVYSSKFDKDKLGLAFNSSKFEQVGDFEKVDYRPSSTGTLLFVYTRLVVKSSKAVIFFAVTNFPRSETGQGLPECDTVTIKDFAQDYITAIQRAKQPGDFLVLAGDFSCPGLMKLIRAKYPSAANGKNGSAIFTSGGEYPVSYVRVDSAAANDGAPSDHEIVNANLSMLVPLNRSFVVM